MVGYTLTDLLVNLKLLGLFFLCSESSACQRLHQTVLLHMQSLQFSQIGFPKQTQFNTCYEFS